MAGTLLGSLLDFGTSFLSNAMGGIIQRNTNEANRQMVESTNAMNQAINERNIQFQQQENEIARQREDNAVQRRAQDLVNAGLSKTLAAGSAASANAMQAGQATLGMQHSTDVAYKPSAYQGFETAMNHVRQNEINEESLELTRNELELRNQALAEEIRHNKAMEEENSGHNRATEEENARYHDLMDKWEEAKLNQNSEFHEDAMKFSWADHELEINKYLTDAEHKEFQNLWYSTQIELLKHTDEREAMELTARLAESSAKVELYASQVKLNDKEVEYLKANIYHVVSEIVRNSAYTKYLKAQTQETLIDSLVKLYNLVVSRNQGINVGSNIPSDKELDFTAEQNALDRSNYTTSTTISTVSRLIQIGVMAFFGTRGFPFANLANGNSKNPIGFR